MCSKHTLEVENSLKQCFSTTVLWQISVLCENVRCAVKNYPMSLHANFS